MTFADFRASTDLPDAPAGLSPVLHALWLDARGEWDRAHEVAQDIPDPDGAWVHAYLHRKEGDLGNAEYWYRRARQPVAAGPLEEEWSRIVQAFLAAPADDHPA